MQQPELEYIEHIKEAPMNCRVVSMENNAPHWHHEYEVLFVMRGTITVNCENESSILSSGDMILLNTQEVHSVSLPEKDNLCIVLQFSPGVLLEFYDTLFTFRFNTASDSTPCAAAVRELQIILSNMGTLIFYKPDGYQFFLKSHLYTFVGMLFRNLKYRISNAEEQNSTKEQLEEFNVIKAYIKKHFKEELKQDHLCKALGLSRAKLYRLLRAAGSASTRELTNYYRVEYAKNLLRTTDFSIPYIATESGFDSDSSFYRVFKELTCVSPNQYRDSPEMKAVPIGIQGYADYPVTDAVHLMQQYMRPGPPRDKSPTP